VRAVLHGGEDGSLMTSASPSQITSPYAQPTDLRERTNTIGVIENRRVIFILKKEFLRDSAAPCRFSVVVSVAKRGLCRLEVNFIVKFSYFFAIISFSYLLCPSVLYFLAFVFYKRV
jgi:hypothetical protein